MSTFSWIMIEQMSNWIDKSASSRENMSLGVCDQVRLKPNFGVMTSKRQSFQTFIEYKNCWLLFQWTWSLIEQKTIHIDLRFARRSIWSYCSLTLHVISTKVNTCTILNWPHEFSHSQSCEYHINTSPKINSFSCAAKTLWHLCTNFWINPHNGKLPRMLAPAQCQNSLAPQLLSNNCCTKRKTSISLNRVYWYDTMCHIFSCYQYHVPPRYIYWIVGSILQGLYIPISEWEWKCLWEAW